MRFGAGMVLVVIAGCLSCLDLSSTHGEQPVPPVPLRQLLAENKAEHFFSLIDSLQTAPSDMRVAILQALKKNPTKPKLDNPAPFRAVLLSEAQIPEKMRWSLVEVLRSWTQGKAFGADDGDWKAELRSWQRWYQQNFPKEAPINKSSVFAPEPGKYKRDELAKMLTKVGGDPLKGKLAFTKGLCIKCHRFGNEGEAQGPDLTMISQRLKRAELLDAIFDPSASISDQYRSSTLILKSGSLISGLAVERGKEMAVLLQDGNKEVVLKSEVEQQFASLVSLMPEKLLDYLTPEEIVDLFAFLETPPKK